MFDDSANKQLNIGELRRLGRESHLESGFPSPRFVSRDDLSVPLLKTASEVFTHSMYPRAWYRLAQMSRFRSKELEFLWQLKLHGGGK